MEVGILLSNLRKPLDEALDIAAELGVGGVQVPGTGEWDPREVDTAGRKALGKKVRDRGLEITAVCAWGGNVDLGDREKHSENIAWGKQLLELAADLECGIWQAHVGIMPHNQDDPRWQNFVDACGALADHGEKIGASVALETGPEPASVLQTLMEVIDSPGLGINYDPANLIIWPARMRQRGVIEGPYVKDEALAEFEPTEGVKRLGPWIKHVHAKDAMVDDEHIAHEVPLGEGWVGFPRFISLLREVGYDGFVTIERETGADPVGDVRRAVEFLKQQVK